MNAAEIKAMLASRTLDVCKLLLSNGIEKGGEWICGDVNNNAGSSLKVRLKGPKAGLWADFAANKQGDIIGLWMECKGHDFVSALREIKGWLGIEDRADRKFARPFATERKFIRPTLDKVTPLESGGAVFDYLTKERCIPAEVLRAYEVGQMTHGNHGATCVFPAHEPSGKAVDLIKFLAVERDDDGKKRAWSTADSRDHLIGWKTVQPNDREICITEGEIDAFTVASWGTRALSIPRGVKAFDWIEHDYEALERFERILICTDMDSEGNACAEQIAQRLGRTRCYRVTLPMKDANEGLMHFDMGREQWQAAVAEARTLDPDTLRSIGDFAADAWEALHPTSERAIGTEPPISMPWRCRHGEVTLWSGINGHGKSQLLMQFALHDASQGQNVCVASLEMPGAKIAAQLVRMTMGKMPAKTEEQPTQQALQWLAQHFWIIDRVGVMPWRELLPIMEYAAKRYGCTRFVIDSLVRCGIGEEDYDQQKEFVGALTTFAGKFGHVHIVAHPRKGQDEAQVPGKMDVRGSGTLADLVHNGFTVWRNKDKEQRLQMVNPNDIQTRFALEKAKDGQLTVWKQREGGEEPIRGLWLHKPSQQFLDSPEYKPRIYFPAK